ERKQAVEARLLGLGVQGPQVQNASGGLAFGEEIDDQIVVVVAFAGTNRVPAAVRGVAAAGLYGRDLVSRTPQPFDDGRGEGLVAEDQPFQARNNFLLLRGLLPCLTVERSGCFSIGCDARGGCIGANFRLDPITLVLERVSRKRDAIAGVVLT